MAKGFPFPYVLVVDHPTVITLPNSAWHIVIALTLAFWRSECRPLPRGNHDLAAIARSDVSTYGRNDVVISKALALVCPILHRAMVEEVESQQRRVIRARKAGLTAAASRRTNQASGYAIHAEPQKPIQPLPAVRRVSTPARTHKGFSDVPSAGKGHVGGMVDVQTGARAGQGILKGDAAPPAVLDSLPRAGHDAWTWQPSPTPPPKLDPD